MTTSPKTIVLFRHLPTTDDVTDYYTAAEADPALVEIQAERLLALRSELGAFCDSRHAVRVVFSDNPRGRRSAHMMMPWLKTSVNAEFDARLNNILQPEWAGMHQSEVRKTERYRVWHDNPEKVVFEKGESLADVESRVRLFCGELDERPTLVISHTTPMQVLTCHLLGISPTKIWTLKFEHLRFSLIYSGILCRMNTETISDFNSAEVRT